MTSSFALSGPSSSPGDGPDTHFRREPRMSPDTAIALISEISYKPNFTLHAYPNRSNSGAVSLDIDYEVPNSNVEYAPEYTFVGTVSRTFTLQVSEISVDDELYQLVFQCLLQIETHECREFFGTGGNQYEKPFHPHTPDGIRNWRTLRPIHILDDVPAGYALPIALARRPMHSTRTETIQ